MTQTKLGWPPHASRGKQPWRMASAAGTLARQSGFSFLVTARRKTAMIVASFPAFRRPWGRRYIFPMPAAEKTIVIGSSNGWLMLEGELSRVQAFNPLRKAKVFFPPSRNRYFEYFWLIKKAVFVPPKAGLGRNNSPALAAILRVRVEMLGVGLRRRRRRRLDVSPKNFVPGTREKQLSRYHGPRREALRARREEQRPGLRPRRREALLLRFFV